MRPACAMDVARCVPPAPWEVVRCVPPAPWEVASGVPPAPMEWLQHPAVAEDCAGYARARRLPPSVLDKVLRAAPSLLKAA